MISTYWRSWRVPYVHLDGCPVVDRADDTWMRYHQVFEGQTHREVAELSGRSGVVWLCRTCWPAEDQEHAVRMGVLANVSAERDAQIAQWGRPVHPHGTGSDQARRAADQLRDACQKADDQGAITWAHILVEEVAEALAETDPARLRAELTQVLGVGTAWLEQLDQGATSGSD